MRDKVWHTNEQGNTYRIHGNQTFIFNGTATAVNRRRLTEYIKGTRDERPGEWAVITENPVQEVKSPTPEPPSPPKPSGPIRIRSPIKKSVQSRTRMCLAKRNATH